MHYADVVQVPLPPLPKLVRLGAGLDTQDELDEWMRWEIRAVDAFLPQGLVRADVPSSASDEEMHRAFVETVAHEQALMDRLVESFKPAGISRHSAGTKVHHLGCKHAQPMLVRAKAWIGLGDSIPYAREYFWTIHHGFPRLFNEQTMEKVARSRRCKICWV